VTIPDVRAAPSVKPGVSFADLRMDRWRQNATVVEIARPDRSSFLAAMTK